MAGGTVFIVVPSASADDFTAFARDTLAQNHRASARILTDETKSGYVTDIRDRVAQNLIETLSAYDLDRNDLLFIHRDAKCSHDALRKWWKLQGLSPDAAQTAAPERIKKSLKQHWEATGRHWRNYAAGQIANFDGRTMPFEQWIGQFGPMGYAAVGRKLAAQLRVIRLAEMQGQPFTLRSADMIGQTQAHCYVKDDDHGGSWADIQGILTHSHPPKSVFPVEWSPSARTIVFPDADVDQFVLYEDGLWSGLETVRRLEAMKATLPLPQVVMRFGIISDFGLLIGRHAIRSLGLADRVLIDTSSSELIRLLRNDLPDELRIGRAYSCGAYFTALHDYAVPLAFGSEGDWADEERQFCREVGSQLVEQWLTRESGKRPSQEKISRFALGGGGFAATTLFARSVPKVCLPMLWLDGSVTINSTTVNWKPLFLDARRISDTALLFATE